MRRPRTRPITYVVFGSYVTLRTISGRYDFIIEFQNLGFGERELFALRRLMFFLPILQKIVDSFFGRFHKIERGMSCMEKTTRFFIFARRDDLRFRFFDCGQIELKLFVLWI